MKQAYRILSYLLSLEVLIQAAVIAWFAFGVTTYADDHGSISHDKLENGGFGGSAGLGIHAVNGFMIIPLIALALLVVSFFAKITGGVRLAVITFVLVVVQAYLLPALSEKAPAVGMLHGAVAIAILGLTIVSGRKAGEAGGAGAAPARAA